jgi:hypothetical protein
VPKLTESTPAMKPVNMHLSESPVRIRVSLVDRLAQAPVGDRVSP